MCIERGVYRERCVIHKALVGTTEVKRPLCTLKLQKTNKMTVYTRIRKTGSVGNTSLRRKKM